MSAPPERHPAVPDDARWLEEEREWEDGHLDGQGRRDGEFRFWRADGSLCSEGRFEHGIPQGPFKRYHEDGRIAQEGVFERGRIHGTQIFRSCDDHTTEKMPEGVHPSVWRAEFDKDMGRVTAVRLFDREGRRVLPDGSLYPERPSAVPDGAEYDQEARRWRVGRFEEAGKKAGLWRWWDEDGALTEETQYSGGERHGLHRRYEGGETVFVAGFRDGEPHGPCFSRADEGDHADKSVRAFRGAYRDGFASGVWSYIDGTGRRTLERDLGVPPAEAELFGSPVFTDEGRTAQEWEALGGKLRDERRIGEALCASAREAAAREDDEALAPILAKVRVELSPVGISRLTQETLEDSGESGAHLVNALLRGAEPAAILRQLAVLLDGRLRSRAALDYIDAAMLLEPERLEYLYTRAMIHVNLGREDSAREDAKTLESASPEESSYLLDYLRVLFPSFDFWPDREKPATRLKDLPSRPVRGLEAVLETAKKYALRLTRVRQALLAKAEPTREWMPPDLSSLLTGGEPELRSGKCGIPGGAHVEVDEDLDPSDWEVPALLRSARADWNALTWLCWASGSNAVALPDSLDPPGDFSAAAGMARERLMLCRDRRLSGGEESVKEEAPGFRWEGLEVDELHPALLDLAEAQYAEMWAVFRWLMDPDTISPWQDGLRDG